MRIDNKQLIELFGNESQKLYYEKYKKVPKDIKECILNQLKNQYVIVEDLGRGKYNIDKKYNGSIIIPNDKIYHDIYGKLIPTILLNVKNFHDKHSVFCLPITKIYISYNMIHNNNYTNIKNRPSTASYLLDLNRDNTDMFFKSVNTSLKYYMTKTLDLLSTFKLISYRLMPYVVVSNKKSEHSVDCVLNTMDTLHRRATIEEEQFIKDLKDKLDKKYNAENGRDRYHGINSKMYIKDEISELNSIGIERKYDCFEVFCENKQEILNILNFYNINDIDLNQLSSEFVNNFINITIKNAENKEIKIEERDKFISDYHKLIDLTLNPDSKNVYIPHYETKVFDYGSRYVNKIEKCK